MIYRIYDDSGTLVFTGRSWSYARRYLDYLCRTLVAPPSLEVKPETSVEALGLMEVLPRA